MKVVLNALTGESRARPLTDAEAAEVAAVQAEVAAHEQALNDRIAADMARAQARTQARADFKAATTAKQREAALLAFMEAMD